MQVVSTRAELRDVLAEVRRASKSIGLVPTMGALHEGHLSLVDAARSECDFTVVTIFVNPTQFGPHEDLQKYPRSLESDLAKLKARDANLVFTPTTAEMYAADYATHVDVGPIANRLEGEIRPAHFRGVATVVLKFFHLIPANRAYFGQKDFQQSLVIRQMVADLNVPIEIRVCPTIREPDGLAMSSRNAYLTADERRKASSILRSLRAAAERVGQGERNPARLREQMQEVLTQNGIETIDYIALVDPQTLIDVASIDSPILAAIAVRVGTTRLIDNELLTP